MLKVSQPIKKILVPLISILLGFLVGAIVMLIFS